MQEELFKKIVDECAENSIKEIHPFLMNEPLLDERIFERVDYLKRKNPDAVVEINTNASLLNKEKRRQLAKSDVDIINFDVQGANKNVYEKITQNLNFEQTVKNVKNFLEMKKANDPVIKLTALLGVLSKEELDEMIEFWKGEGIKIEIVGTQDRAGNLNEENIKFEEVDTTKDIFGCEHDRHLKWFNILFNGDVILCCQDWNREVILGNVKEKSIKEIWNSENYKGVRSKLSSKKKAEDDFLCKKCSYAVR